MSLAVDAASDINHHTAHAPIVPDFSRHAFCIQGLLCDVVMLDEAEQKVVTSIKTARRCNVVTPNANFLRLSRSDPDFRDAVLASDLSVIDGMPLVWLARALGIPVPERVCGSDLCSTLMAAKDEHFSAFFFGATDDVGRRVRQRLDERRSGLTCAGVYAPGYGSVASMSDPEILDNINGASPDLLIVSLGARKGVVWLNQNEHRLSAPVTCHLGAVIHFIAGTVVRAPPFFRRYGLEWLWRIKEEPALWTRYALDLTTLLSALVGQLVPCLVQRALHKPSAATLAKARLQHRHQGSSEIIKFSGPWTIENLAPVRSVLAEATADPNDLVIDLDSATYVDAAFLGQLLIAYGYQRRMHRNFVLRASRGQIRRMLRSHGCGYLLADRREGRRQIRPRSYPARQTIAGARKLWARTFASGAR